MNTPTGQKLRQLLKTKEVAELIRRTERTVYRLGEAGEIEAATGGRFFADSVAAYQARISNRVSP